MKNLFFLFSLMLMSVTMSAQRFIDIQNVSSDTLTNQTTKTYTTNPVLLDVPYYYSIYVAADSLSGSNAGTAKLQVCNDRTGTNWSTLQTLTIDGTGTDSALWEGLLYARRVRIYFDMPSGTRKVKPHVEASFKRVY